MTTKNDRNVPSTHDGTVDGSSSLNHSDARENRIESKHMQSDELSDMSRWRKHSFNVILPRKLSEQTENDLKLMRVSLKNAISVSTVHMRRIERELEKRGCNLTILV
ncbi:MAG: hypothetical protein ACFFDM_03500 [Candidatus Thorarchaeota archaeon]